MIELSNEFYNMFNYFTKEQVNEGISRLKPYVQNQIFHFYSVDSKYNTSSRSARDAVNVLKREIYKQYKMHISELIDKSEEELMKAIEIILNENQKRILYKEYTFSQTAELKEKLTDKEQKILYGIIKILKYHFNPNFDESDKFKYTSFFSIFPGTKTEYIYKALKYLSKEERKLIHKKYGADLTNTRRVMSLTSEENIRIGTLIIPKIKKCISKLEAGYIFIGIDQIFPDLTFNEIKRRVEELLNDSERQKIYNLFGSDLSHKLLLKNASGEKIINKRILDKINMVKKENKRNNKIDYPTPIKPFYDIFRNFKNENETEEEYINKVNSCIRKNQLEKLVKKYGENLRKIINDGYYSKKEDEYIIKVIIPVIKVRLKRIEENNEIKYKTLKDRLPIFAKDEDFIYALSKLTNEEIVTLAKRFGYNMDIVLDDITKEELYQIKLLIGYLQRYIYQNIKNRTGLKILYLKKIKELTTTEEYIKLLDNYTPEESLSILIKIYIPEIPTKQIELLTGINSEIITLITKDYLEYFKKELTGFSLEK